MTISYEVALQKEILREVGANVLASFYHYFQDTHISINDEQNPIVIFYKDLVEIHNGIYGAHNTLDDLKKVEGQFQLANDYILKLGAYCD